jgi:beta-glucosidase
MAPPPPDPDALLARMTLEEKIGQLTMVSADMRITGPGLAPDWAGDLRAGRVGGLLNLWGRERARAAQRLAVEETRVGIPLLLGFDVLHGHRTIVPIPLGEAATFDPELWERTAAMAAAEAAEDGVSLAFAPSLDVSRDPRWGRVAEGPGEDPWLACAFAAAKIAGFQGAGPGARLSLAACAKHLGGYGAVTGGREYAPVDVSDRQLEEVYLPPFAAAVASGVAALMPAFNDLAGVPVTGDRALLDGIVRGRWGFEGVVISDYNAIAELVAHGVAADLGEAATLALRAGVDVDMMGFAYREGLPVALARGAIVADDIDTAVRRVLDLKIRLGLFADPFRAAPPADAATRAARRALARAAAARAMVLLTNRDDTLPLPRDLRRIAVVGPLAEAGWPVIGTWGAAGHPDTTVRYLAGLRAALPGVQVDHALGVELEAGGTDGIAAAVAAASAAEVVILMLGESGGMSGEAASRARCDLPGHQAELARAVLDAGRPVVTVLTAGRPLVLPWLLERSAAVLMAWAPGSEAGNALADVLTGAVAPAGRLPMSWPADIGQIPVFFGQRPTGRPARDGERYTARYLDVPVEPAFPFGHGLAYTRFSHGAPRLDRAVAAPGESVTVEVDVTNTGARPGEETVLLFTRDPVAAVARPLLELRGVAKLALGPGATATARLVLAVDDLAYLGPDLLPRLDAGEILILTGPSADPARLLQASLRVVTG